MSRTADPTRSGSVMRSAGARLRTVRRARGLTQEDLAHATGVSRSAVAQWESGRADYAGRLTAIASALNVTSRELAEARLPSFHAGGEDLSGTELEGILLRNFRLLEQDDQACLLRIVRRLASIAD